MSNPLTPDSVPHEFQIAFAKVSEELQKTIVAASADEEPANEFELCRAIEEFVARLKQIPGYELELERRTEIVKHLTADGSDYDRARQAFLSDDPRKLQAVFGRYRAIKELRNCSENPQFLWYVIAEREELEKLMAPRPLRSCLAVPGYFVDWLNACETIQRNVEPLEPDGCGSLLHIYRVMQESPGTASPNLGHWLEYEDFVSMREAAESLSDAVRDGHKCGADKQPPSGGPPKPQGDKPRRPATVNQRMLEYMVQNTEAMGWTAQQWSLHLSCAKSTVVDTDAWKYSSSVREKAQAERAQDRRRKPRSNRRRRN